MARRPPWYSFLYGLLGAHGTFWLWVVAVATLWFTGRDAIVSMVNRYPEKRTVSEAATRSDLRRWVVLPGVRVVLDGRLLLRDDASEFEGAEILIDQDDPAAHFWRTTRAIADADAGQGTERLERAGAASSELALLGCVVAQREARENLRTRYKLFQTGAQTFLPRSEQAILLLDERVAPINSQTANGAPPLDPIEAYERLVTAWRDAIRARVSVAAPRGLLDDAPSKVLERLERDPGIQLGKNALRTNRTPNDAELYVFCAAALVFLFLATGLYGVVSAGRASSP